MGPPRVAPGGPGQPIGPGGIRPGMPQVPPGSNTPGRSFDALGDWQPGWIPVGGGINGGTVYGPPPSGGAGGQFPGMGGMVSALGGMPTGAPMVSPNQNPWLRQLMARRATGGGGGPMGGGGGFNPWGGGIPRY
jgi:hypothetical protein